MKKKGEIIAISPARRPYTHNIKRYAPTGDKSQSRDRVLGKTKALI